MKVFPYENFQNIFQFYIDAVKEYDLSKILRLLCKEKHSKMCCLIRVHSKKYITTQKIIRINIKLYTYGYKIEKNDFMFKITLFVHQN